MTMKLTSPAFDDGARIPKRFTCEGEDISPALHWTGVPATARSLALICEDPDAPMGIWYHWALFDLPPTTDHLDENQPTTAEAAGGRQAVNDFGRFGYGGPCPPRGHGVHHYRFRLLALDVARLDIGEAPSCADVVTLAEAHRLEETVLTGTYSRD